MTLRLRFDDLADAIEAHTREGEFACALLQAEQSDFVRVNGARIRQAGLVERGVARLRLVQGDRQAVHLLTLPGLHSPQGQALGDAAGAGHDAVHRAVAEALDHLRALIVDSQADPLLDVNRDPVVSDDRGALPLSKPFDRAALIDTIADAAGTADLVGFCAAGPIARGFCSSTGSRQWYERHSVQFDWSIHLPVDAADGGERRAVKASWSAAELDPQALHRAVLMSCRDAQVMARPVRRISPGDYRALFSPRAFGDLLEMLSWGGFSARAHLTGQSPLSRLRNNESRFSPLLSLAEDLDAGFAPGFQADGYLRPRRIALIDRGGFSDWLVSPQSAREFGLQGNAASSGEAPDCVRVSAGALAADQALAALGTGVSISNLWYLNFSDRPSCRVTGMTRFACLWVEDGEPLAPIEAMRFDDSLYSVLGEALEALGDRCERLPATESYDGRATGGIEVPAALTGALRFVP